MTDYPHTSQLYCRQCRTMTLHQALSTQKDRFYTRLMWGTYRCPCGGENRTTLTARDYEALGKALEEA